MNSRLCQFRVLVMTAMSMLLAASQTVFAVTPNDFAFGLELEVDSTKGPVAQFQLPAEVLKDAGHSNLADLRIFNSAGNEVPMGIVALETSAPEHRRERVAAFSLELPNAGGSDDVTIEVQRDAQGVITAMHAAPRNQPQNQSALILVAAHIDRPYREVKLEWQTPPKSFVHAVSLEASDDLRNWRMLADDWVVAHIKRGSKTIRHDRYSLSPTTAKYLRIRFTSNDNLPDIRTALLDTSARRTVLPLTWTDIELKPVAGNEGRFEFSIPSAQVSRKLHVLTSVENAYSRVKIERYSPDDERWVKVGSTAVYRLSYPAGEVRNEPIRIAHSRPYRWALEVPDGTAELDGVPPTARVGWVSQLVAFVARGDGPYTLAYGHLKDAKRARDARTLLRELGVPDELTPEGFELPKARVVRAVTLGGPALLVPQPEPIDWQRIVLWGVLLGAVVVLLAMARQLLRERPDVNGESAEEGERVAASEGADEPRNTER